MPVSRLEQTKHLAKISLAEFVRAVKVSRSETISSGSPSPLELLHSVGIGTPLILISQEQLRIRRFLEWLQETLFGISPSSSRKGSLHKVAIWGSQLKSVASIQPVISALRNRSLFQCGELIVLYEADKIPAALAKKLIEVFRKGSPIVTPASELPSALVVLVLSSWEKKSAFSGELGGVSTVIEVEELQGSELIRWVQKEALRSGATGGITKDAAWQLVQSYGNNLSRLSEELGKLSLLTEVGKPINRALVEEISFKAPESTSFELVTHIAAKRAKEALAMTNSLMQQGLHPLQINAFLSRSFRTLLFQKNFSGTFAKRSTLSVESSVGTDSSKGKKKDADGKAKKSAELTNPWFVKKLNPLLPYFSTPELLRSIELLRALDIKLKSSKLSDQLLVSLTVQEMTLR